MNLVIIWLLESKFELFFKLAATDSAFNDSEIEYSKAPSYTAPWGRVPWGLTVVIFPPNMLI